MSLGAPGQDVRLPDTPARARTRVPRVGRAKRKKKSGPSLSSTRRQPAASARCRRGFVVHRSHGMMNRLGAEVAYWPHRDGPCVTQPTGVGKPPDRYGPSPVTPLARTRWLTRLPGIRKAISAPLRKRQLGRMQNPDMALLGPTADPVGKRPTPIVDLGVCRESAFLESWRHRRHAPRCNRQPAASRRRSGVSVDSWAGSTASVGSGGLTAACGAVRVTSGSPAPRSPVSGARLGSR